MLIRFVTGNVLSFDENKEFNMLPMPKYRRLDEHKYVINNFNVLKLASIYGANGAGKSNLIKSLSFLKTIVVKDELPIKLKGTRFKFNESAKSLPQTFAVEFFQEDISFYYGIELVGDNIQTEELYLSGLGREKDLLIFERVMTEQGNYKITFLEEFEKDVESQVLKNVIEKNLIKPNQTLLKLLPSLNNSFLGNVSIAYKWFEDTLQIIYPDSKPGALVHRMDTDADFKNYAQEIMCSFNIGITDLQSDKRNLKDLVGGDNENDLDELVKKIEETPKKMIGIRTKKGDEIILVKENEDFFIKQLKLKHKGKDDVDISFDLDEESDGTIRLLDFIPAFKDLLTKKRVYVIDEIERSIHPLLIKELITKFSFDDKTLGQLIFTTHESNLLDQNIFRQDEIWFAEKNRNGSTDLYSLSDFKEHNTIDIKKGYLNGRYGSIPFLGNLKDLNWHKYDDSKKQ